MMIPVPIPKNEGLRLETLRSLNLLYTLPDARLDAITRFTAENLNSPICLISLVDSDRQWYKSSYGTDSKEDPRGTSFCAHAICEVDSNKPDVRIFEVNDTKEDSRFCNNPIIVGPPWIRSYLSYVIQSDSGMNIGTLCIDDIVPRQFSDINKQMLILMGRMAENIIHERHHLDGIKHKFD